MAHKRSTLIQALDRSEAKKDGGFKQNWSFSVSDDSEEEKGNDASVVTMEEGDNRRSATSEGEKSPPLKHFCTSEPLKTYERRPNHLRMYKGNAGGPNKLGVGKPLSETMPTVTSAVPNRTNYFILSPAPSQGVVVQGRLFQHANAPGAVRKVAQSNLDLKERKDYTTQQIQRVELDSIILTCPEIPATNSLVLGGDIKRRIQNKRSNSLEASGSFLPPAKKVEALDPQDYLTVCGKCSKPSENHVKCQNCGNPLSQDAPRPAEPAAPLVRPPVRPHASPGPTSLALSKSFYGSASVARVPRVDVVMNPPVRITRGSLLLPHNGRPGGLGGAGLYGTKGPKGRRQPAAKQDQLNDPIVLSSDDEEEDTDNASTGSVNRMDSVSPRPGDSAHSSPAPSGGRVEAAVKGVSEQEEVTDGYATDVISKVAVPRKSRMKDQFGNMVPDGSNHSPSQMKRRKVSLSFKLDSIILDCRSVRLGTLRRMVTKPVIFTVEYIQIETEAPEEDMLEKVKLRASELVSCEWCSTRKLPSVFLQTTPAECMRLRAQLHMSRDSGGVWYDSSSTDPDEKYIVLIFENGLSMPEQVILEDILQEIGRANKLPDFPAKLSFEEANIRLVQYNKAKGKASETGVQTRLSSRLQAAFDDDEEEDMAELQPTFTGPVVKLIVYPPPPAKGGISVTNEDLHCLNDGEFLNDVIIDFYLKYLFLEKLKKEDAHRSHVFSSFFYKRLNQRERRVVPDTANLPIQKRKHNRVKTWTRHVDLFQKDFIFVPINESAHWYLAVICFPGLEGPRFEPNPLYQAQASAKEGEGEGKQPAGQEEAEGAPEQTPPAATPTPTPTSGNPCLSTPTDASSESDSNSDQPRGAASSSDGAQEGARAPSAGVNGQSKAEPHYTDALHRISVCYGSRDGAEDACTFSDDQSSSQEECSEDGAMADDSLNSPETTEWTSKPTICKQPCILIMDSLRGPTRSTVVKTLREYLEVEWEVRKGTPRSFGKDVLRGSSPRVPQQDNYSDCGVYILQYVESFFESPLPSYHLPMNLTDWFPQQRMKTKREEIKELILRIQSQQHMDKKGLGPSQGQNPPNEPDPGAAAGSAQTDTAVSS
ncbi:sentrin-specific protease 6 isoform X1 [Megalops cyprinoides]|uniref:sentrin-specific protease 6 isoform X1 n=2 Tax=Megalops cyprinoides TaxID=118141 RepID=UPI001865428A|nr:sentrin-specific protease 6 isoform X1 [Megalops cyprinoides]